jgi:predicted PurR-regulated permease PerM
MVSRGVVLAALKAFIRVVSTYEFYRCEYGRTRRGKVYAKLHFSGSIMDSLKFEHRILRCHEKGEALMKVSEHLQLTGGALKNWFVAQLQDSLAVGVLWLVGLWVIGVPWALLWAALGALFQFVPQIGAVLGVVGPALTAMLRWGDWEHPLYVLMLYAIIAVVDGFLLQPYLMKRTARIPIWVSILSPIVLGIVIPFWGVLLAPPLLAIVYAYRARMSGSEKLKSLP